MLVCVGFIITCNVSPPIESLLLPESYRVTTNVCTIPATASVTPYPDTTVLYASAVVTLQNTYIGKSLISNEGPDPPG